MEERNCTILFQLVNAVHLGVDFDGDFDIREPENTVMCVVHVRRIFLYILFLLSSVVFVYVICVCVCVRVIVPRNEGTECLRAIDGQTYSVASLL